MQWPVPWPKTPRGDATVAASIPADLRVEAHGRREPGVFPVVQCWAKPSVRSTPVSVTELAADGTKFTTSGPGQSVWSRCWNFDSRTVALNFVNNSSRVTSNLSKLVSAHCGCSEPLGYELENMLTSSSIISTELSDAIMLKDNRGALGRRTVPGSPGDMHRQSQDWHTIHHRGSR